MKLLCTYLIIVGILCSLLIMPIGAEQKPLSGNEADDLIQNAIDVFTLVFYGDRLGYPSDHPKGNKMLSNVNSVPERWYAAYTCIDNSKLPGGTIEGFIDLLKSIYVDSLANEYCINGYYITEIPLFVTDNEGDIFIAWNDADRKRINMKTLDDVTVELIDSSSDFAIARVGVDVNISNSDMGHKWIKAWVECKFENTSSGWRISDCAFFDMLNSYQSNFEWTPVESPSTGDLAGERVAVIGAVSLACIIPTACLMRRRRRASAE